MAVIVNPNQEDQNQQTQGQQLQTIGTAAPSGQGASGSPTAKNMANQLNQQQRQGSGRFTNLQKYLQANSGAGQRIAQQIGQNVNQNLQQQQQKTQQYSNQLGQSINQANQTAQQGAGFQQQLQNMGQNIAAAQTAGFDQRANQGQALANIEAFTQNPDFQRFQDIQAGRGINQDLLALQQQKAAQQAAQTQASAQQAQQQLGSEAGRFELLRQAFGGNTRPGYSTGQQRLDQVLLGQGGGLGQVQSDVAAQNRAAQQQARLVGSQGGEVSRLTAAEQGLIEDINKQASSNEDAYYNMLQGYIDPLNQQRAAQVEALNKSIGAYAGTPEAQAMWQSGETTGFTPEQLAELGITGEQGVYNVFKGPGGVTQAQDIVNVGREAANAQDVANQQDVNRYQALAKIAGIAPEQSRLTQASDLGAAYTNKEDEGALANRLAAAQAQWDQSSQNPFTYRRPSAIFDYRANANDLINQGRNAIGFYYDQPYNPTGTITASTQQQQNAAAADAKKYGSVDPYQRIVDQFKNFINQQNYNQTIGGKRQTFLDTEEAQRLANQGITPKADATPITAVDPSIAYKNALNNIIKGS